MKIEMTVHNQKPTTKMTVHNQQPIEVSINKPTGTAYYSALIGKPSIEGTILVEGLTLKDIGINIVTEQQIDKILYRRN